MRHAALPGVIALYAAASLSLGCSDLRIHATAAQATREALDATAGGIDLACEPDDVRVSDEPATRARRCLRAAEVHDAAREAWDTWVDAILLAASGGDFDAMAALTFGLDLARLYGEVADILRAWGHSPPDLPDLIGGSQ
ncbi:MAG: hypothetical protein GY944_24490 [bacterium]|nr:hypothetical protein [bacterium]